jgi:hypothetical protein
MGDRLIHTCELNGANPFDYRTELQRHTEQVKAGTGGCPGTTASGWRLLSAASIPGRMDKSTAWPKRIDCGHGRVTC